ncbi:hypothetical protein [Gynuella sp.]|uniref:hypothetical protein n=1 Tax=Gynuella sp. TaxID=2969146 RepID=UPI003D133442
MNVRIQTFRRKNSGSIFHQRGVAALLLVLLVGISATVVTLGTMSYVRGSQKSQMTVHGQTQAEINAWTGAEALGQYLNGIEVDTVTTAMDDVVFSRDNKKIASAEYKSDCSQPSRDLYCFDVNGTSAGHNSNLEVVYQIPIIRDVSYTEISNPIVIKGDTDVTGGGITYLSSDSIDGFAVDGNLNITNATESVASGCATGDIHVDGGGVEDNGHLYSSNGDITLEGLNLVGADIWGGNINIFAGSGFNFKSIKAVKNLNVTNAGNFKSDFIHANAVSFALGGQLGETLVHSDITFGNNKSYVDYLEAGGNLIFHQDDQSHVPEFARNSKIAGKILVRSGETLSAHYNSRFKNIEQGRTTTDPGVPEWPECNVDATPFDVNTLISQANYIFYIDDSDKPMLKIQNVKRASDDKSIDATIDLSSEGGMNTAYLHNKPFFQCEWGSKSCITSKSNSTDGWVFDGVAHFPPGVILFAGKGNPNQRNLAPMNFTLASKRGEVGPLLNTILVTGDITLGGGGGGLQINAPYFSSPDAVCGGDFYPANLCDKSSGSWQFEGTWDGDRVERNYPVANTSIMVNHSMTSSGWSLEGSVIVGDTFKTDKAMTNVHGVIVIGLNSEEGGGLKITEGGIVVDFMDLDSNFLNIPTGNTQVTDESTLGIPTAMWARYY